MLRPFISLSLSGLCVLSLFSCGKEQKDVSTGGEIYEAPIKPDPEKQQVFCEKSSACPSHLAKVMVVEQRSRRFCTGTLIDSRILMTSTSCLPKQLRSAGVSCSKDVFFFFEKSNDGTPEMVGCTKVLQVSELQGGNPALWRDDVALLELDQPMHWRRKLAIDRNGLPEDRTYSYFTVDQVDEHKGIIRKRDCLPSHNSYVNPLASHPASPNMVISGCDFYKSSSGSPLLDSKGRIRALASQGMSETLRNLLNTSGMVLGDPLKPILHATNFACAAVLNDMTVLDERECFKNLEQGESDKKRMELLNSDKLFYSALLETKRGISSNIFMEFDTRLMPFEDHFSPEIFPVCFKNVSSWINKYKKNNQWSFEVSFTTSIYKKMIDPNGKVGPFVSPLAPKKIKILFGPKDLSNLKWSTVTVVDGDDRTVYRNMKACP